VGGADPKKIEYEEALKADVQKRGLSGHISFAGHRSDMESIYRRAAVVVNLSQHAEPFGRTVIESLAMGTPVVAFNSGGPAESLRDCLPQGLVAENDLLATVNKIDEFIKHPPLFSIPQQFTLNHQAEATLKAYHEAIAARGKG
jgi:glycosyltransferase involved in cell wall biosynthesis